MTGRGGAPASAVRVELSPRCRQYAVLGRAVACRGYRVDLDRARRRLELPTGAVTLAFGFGDSLRLTDAADTGGSAEVMTSLVSGVRTTARIAEHAGRVGGVEVSFTPMTAQALFGVPMDAIAESVIDPVDLLGPTAAHIGEQLAECASWSQRFALVDRLLAGRLTREDRSCPEVDWAWRQLRTDATLPVGTVLAETGWSRRRMERRFREYVGVAPKAVSQVARLHRALRLLDTPMTLSRIAVQAGYHDQAHLDRAFKAMTARTPSRLRAERALDPSAARPDRLADHVTSIVLAT
jgi:AraC-like DNA-binding protein